MMEGIEILSIGEIGINPVFNWPVAILAGVLLGLIPAFYIGISEESVPIFIATLILSASLFGGILGFANSKYTDTVPTYKVAISDTVRLNEFYDRYKVLEQDGKIFTVMEKNLNENP